MKNSFRKNSILNKTILFSWAMILLTIVILLLVMVPYQRTMLINRLNASGEGIASSMSGFISRAVVMKKYTYIVDYCVSILKQSEEIEYIVVTRRDGFSLIHKKNFWRQQDLSGQWLGPIDKNISFFMTPHFSKEKIFNFTMPLVYSDVFCGWIHLGISIDKFHDNLRKLYVRTFLLALLCIFIGFVFSFIFAKRLVKPILMLNNTMKKVTGKDFFVKVNVFSNDEVGDLAKTFNSMMINLKESREVLQESRKRFQDVAESTGDWIWEIDKDGQFIYTNDLVENILGYKGHEIIGKHFYDFFYKERKEEILSRVKEIMFNKASFQGFVNENIHKNGKEIIIETSGVPVLDKKGNLLGYRGINKDITEKVKVDNKIKKAKETAEIASSAKSQFLANMSHEIRTPMNSIMGYSQLLKGVLKEKKQREYVNNILSSGKMLLELIRDVLDITKIESGEIILNNKNFSILDLLEDVFMVVEHRLRMVNVELILEVDKDVPRIIRTDFIRLRQVMVNLINNAVKFTPEGKIEVFLKREKSLDTKDKLGFSMRVSDTGIGIPKYKLEKVFDAFVQVDMSSTRKFEGLGLGLFITKKCVKALGGKIEASSELGKGSSFIFTFLTELSLKEKAGEKEKNVYKGPKELKLLKGLRVLVVEDNIINQKLIVELLKNLYCEVEVADDGRRAIEKLKNKNVDSFDLILMDILMPIMDGYEAAEIIRKDIKSDIPIVALSAAAMAENRKKGFAVGMNDYLIKPVDMKKLRDIILKYGEIKKKKKS